MVKYLAILLVGLRLPAAQTASIEVDTARIENGISPRMYAAFVEMMAEDVKRGLTAEMLEDRSFEQSPDYLGLPSGWRLEPDERNDNVGAIKFAQTAADAYPATNKATGLAEHALRVTLAPNDISDTRRGFSQGHLSIRAGRLYNGYAWVKLPQAKRYRGAITALLEEDHTDGETYARATLPALAGDGWQRYNFTLQPQKTDRFAKLTVLFDGAGVLDLDELSLEPADAKAQVRPDSEAMIGRLRPSFLRWPGGNVAQDYHWQWGIGPRDLRPVWTNIAWSNAPEPNDLGTDEYLALCSRLGIEPSITVNVNGAGATPREAADWVEYVNGPATSKFGALRAANGHPAPWGVRQWELGNEVFGNWVRGHADAATYARSAVEYARAMRAVDPGLKLVAVGQGVGKDQEAWNHTVLKIAGSAIDFLAIHDYTTLSSNAGAPNPRAAMLARASQFEQSYRRTAQLIAQLTPQRNIRQIVNEWNLFYSAEVIQSMEGAVYASRMMNGFERSGDTVEANAISDLLNGWVGGVIQASRDRLYATPQFYAIQMYRDHLGVNRLHTVIQSPELAPGVKSIDGVVTALPGTSKVFVKLSNADLSHAIDISLDLGNFPYARDVPLSLLSAPSPQVRNTFSQPDLIKPAEKRLRCSGPCTVQLPPDSVAVLTFSRR